MSNKLKQLANEYFEGMEKKDYEKLTNLADSNVQVISPRGVLQGIEAFKGFQTGFGKMIKSLTLEHILVNDSTVAIIYNANTHPVEQSKVVEILTFKNSKLIRTEVIYDNEPFTEYLKAKDNQ